MGWSKVANHISRIFRESQISTEKHIIKHETEAMLKEKIAELNKLKNETVKAYHTHYILDQKRQFKERELRMFEETHSHILFPR